MTLAKILVVSLLFAAGSAFVSTGGAQESSQLQPSTKSQDSQQQSASPTGDQSKPPRQAAATPATSKKNPNKVRRKKKSVEECTPAADATAAKPGVQPPQSDMASTAAPITPAQGSGPAKKCPPAKIVVNQGGATDSSIQLAGGAPKQTSQAHATADPMLDETESNLKKLEGRQLSSSEQDMVTQIRQYVEQSKTAVAAGDVERARTLAWKAQTLSEDLVKPEKQ